MAIDAARQYERYFEYTTLSVPQDWRRQSGSDPSDLHYYHAMNNYVRAKLWDKSFPPRNDVEQFELDVAFWYGSLMLGPSAQITLLKKVFTVLYHGV